MRIPLGQKEREGLSQMNLMKEAVINVGNRDADGRDNVVSLQRGMPQSNLKIPVTDISKKAKERAELPIFKWKMVFVLFYRISKCNG